VFRSVCSALSRSLVHLTVAQGEKGCEPDPFCVGCTERYAHSQDPDNAGLAMLMSGAGQFGTTIAGIVSFVVVNFFNFFGH